MPETQQTPDQPQKPGGTGQARSVRERERAENPDAPPKPGEILYDDGGMPDSYLVEGTLAELMESLEDVDLQTASLRIVTEWYRVRWTTPEEMADEEWLYQQFGDHQMNGIDTTVVYERLPDEQSDAHLYVRIETVSDPAQSAADDELQHIKRLLRPLLQHESVWQGVERLREERTEWERTATSAQGESDLYREALERVASSGGEAAEMREIASKALERARALRLSGLTETQWTLLRELADHTPAGRWVAPERMEDLRVLESAGHAHGTGASMFIITDAGRSMLAEKEASMPAATGARTDTGASTQCLTRRQHDAM